jgi:hypothetical protein
MGYRKEVPPRREVSAVVQRTGIKPILVQADRALIQCTRQPGRLRISTYAYSGKKKGRDFLANKRQGSPGAPNHRY